MGAPDWQRQSFAKHPTAQKTGTSLGNGIKATTLFERPTSDPRTTVEAGCEDMAGPLKLADGGDVNINGDTIGSYSGDDAIVKYRMNQTDAEGNDLRLPESAKTTTSQAEAQDMENGSGSNVTTTAQATAQDKETGYDSSPVKASAPKASAPKVKDTSTSPAASDARLHARAPKAPPADDFGDNVQAPSALPAKKYIDIPQRAAGVQQYRDDAVSPAEKLLKSLTGSTSQRNKAANKG